MEALTHKDTLTASSLYEIDFYQWAFHNADLLRQGRLTEIDLENIAEELEDMARSSKRELFSRLVVLIMHLLKWQYQPKRRCESWSTTIGNQRTDLELLLADNPSLKNNIETVIDKEFITAKRRFEKETGISARVLPETCLYTFEQLMDYDFWPEESL
ncbi:MAG: DUF29 domain-containing protein [Candidatus Magnetobacterium sp. LHC-1]|uniref:DUF29 domain-containing protein n=1 Tax=Candidatus Magnetobacterium casense TaxID=1455061 RepID=A0ABS6RUD3_9BACT|nr:DUF29 domain-containing protein [Candidatus Magnetobacterium casensis]MBF0609243.1 DUF29 domain-containing protein [Nitrospirota bacterium]MBV6340230.1 DUF29 domain-containing protein [Candidatus Magnetobacterium casensis]